MSEREQIVHLGNEIDRLVDRFRTEYDLSYASVVGVLQMKCWLLMAEAADEE